MLQIKEVEMSRQPEEPIFNRIEELRSAKGLSRQQLADAVGVHYQTVGYLERGEYNPSLSLALKIANTLKTEVGEIFSLNPFRKAKSYV
jgi:DNA-binding XRE family transcriptional regulator